LLIVARSKTLTTRFSKQILRALEFQSFYECLGQVRFGGFWVPFLWGFSILECDFPFFCDEDASGIVAPSSLRFTKNEFGKPNVRALSLSLSLSLSAVL
jgi:hypothetical protein